MLTDRQKQVMRIVLNQPKGIFANEIAKALEVSTRTVRNDIQGINLLLRNDNVQIQSSKRTGYFIMQENLEHLKRCLQDMEEETKGRVAVTSSQRKAYILGRLMKDTSISLGELSDVLYVSEQTVYKDYVSLMELCKKQYHFQALHLINGKAKLEAEESEIRSLFYRICKEIIYQSNKLMDPKLCQMTKEIVDLEELEDIVNYLSSYCKCNGIHVPDQMVFVISWMISFTVNRYENDCLLEKNVEVFQENLLIQKMLKQLFEDLRYMVEEVDRNLLQNYIETLGFYTNGEEVLSSLEVDSIVEEFARQMKQKYNMDFKSIPSLFDNFRIHLRFAIKRLLIDYQLTNPLLKEVKTKYPFAYEVAMMIVPIITKRYGLYISEDEISFLSMYILPFIRAKRTQVKTILAYGTSSSYCHMLSQWLKQVFSNRIDIVAQVPHYQLEETIQSVKADLIISDLPIRHSLGLPVVELGGMLDKKEEKMIDETMSKIGAQTSGGAIFRRVFSASTVLFFDSVKDYEELVRQCAKRLKDCKKIEDKDDFVAKTMFREQVYPTYINNGVWFAHPLENDALNTGIAVAVLHRPIECDGKPVRIVFVGAHEPKLDRSMIHVYDLINKTAANLDLVEVITRMNQPDELIDYLDRIIVIL